MLQRLVRFLPYISAAGLLAVLYLSWVVASRHAADEAMNRARQQRLARGAQPLAADSATGLKLLQFYASTGEIIRGDHAMVCYGVQNASTVRLEPPVEEVVVAENKCFAVTPERTTTYSFMAEDAAGKRVAASFTIHVKPPAARIMELNLGKLEVRRGEAWAFCYKLTNAVKAVFEPMKVTLPPTKHCYQFYPPVTLKYTLWAYGEPGGGDDHYSWTIKVNSGRPAPKSTKPLP